jgi:hypothetical protein
MLEEEVFSLLTTLARFFFNYFPTESYQEIINLLLDSNLKIYKSATNVMKILLENGTNSKRDLIAGGFFTTIIELFNVRILKNSLLLFNFFSIFYFNLEME